MSVFYCILSLVGFSCTFAYDNLSYKKEATQSHTYMGPNYDARNAVDGNPATCMRTNDIGDNSRYKTVWWKVDLGRVYHIYSINILYYDYIYVEYEKRQRGRFAGFSLYVSNIDVSTIADIKGSILCYKDGPKLPLLNFTTTCFEYGRYVIFYNERPQNVTYPPGYEAYNVYTDLCEVIVLGCQSGVYGNYCAIPCPSNCKDNKCHIQKGSCYVCQPGWNGDLCNIKCKEDWYGINCSQQCVGNCRNGTTCNHVTGRCDVGCSEGWTGSMCNEECDDGTFGYDCAKRCSGRCQNDASCNKQTGHCDLGCKAGFSDDDCGKECPSGYYGIYCRERCSGHCLNNESCHHASGVCLNGCQDEYIGIRCNNPCIEGFYGRNCSHTCHFTCQTCRNTDGLCTCKPGWMGPNCTTECVHSYGENCRYQCSVHCINQTCDRLNGRCLFGCIVGRTCNPAIQQNAKTNNDDIACTQWIVAFSIVLVSSIIFIFTTIKLWRISIKRNSNASCSQSSRTSGSGDLQTGFSEGTTHYQEISASTERNTYQTLTLE